MSFFVLDSGNNSVGNNVVPTGTNPTNADVVIKTLVVNQVITPNPVQDAYKALTDNGTSYTMLLEDGTVEVISPTYTSIYLPTTAGNENKKYIIIRSFSGSTILTVYPYSIVETIVDDPSIQLLQEGDTLQIIADAELNWGTL